MDDGRESFEAYDEVEDLHDFDCEFADEDPFERDGFGCLFPAGIALAIRRGLYGRLCTELPVFISTFQWLVLWKVRYRERVGPCHASH